MSDSALVGGIEAGGTKFVCAVGSGPRDVRAELRFPTTTPDETLARAIEFFREQQELHGALNAIGIGSFGPLDLDRDSPTWGCITSTPKPGWSDTDFVGRMRAAFDVPYGWDTDVNAAALAEHRWGTVQGLDTFVYLTIGSGIGCGGMSRGRLLHGLVHPEAGHMRLRRDPARDPYPGRCPYHGDCWEGLAAGPALEERWQCPPSELPPDHEAWELEADYLAQGLVNLILVLSPQRILMGGGVMEQEQLFPKVRRRVLELLADYLRAPAVTEEIESYVVPPALGHRAGMLGSVALAQDAIR